MNVKASATDMTWSCSVPSRKDS